MGTLSWSWMDDSHPFRFMSISHPIPEIRLFQTMTLNLMGVVKAQGHTVGPVSYLLPFHFTSDKQFLKYSSFEIDLKTSKVKVMTWVKGQGHILYPISNQCISFLLPINQANHSWDMAKIVFGLEKNTSKFVRNSTKITVSNRTTPKSNQVISMIKWVVLNLPCRQANWEAKVVAAADTAAETNWKY